MNFTERYQQALTAKGYQADPAQLRVIEEMQRIAEALQNTPDSPAAPKESKGFFSKLFGSNDEAPAETHWIKGLYCWGGVGRGKTFMMDLFVDYLPTERKLRRHFHRFMLELHDKLNEAGNIEDPIDTIVANMKKDIDIICLDEFFVSDITDAMLLSRLLRAMKDHGITIVTTSNIPPDDLYKKGLQREQFLPAIAWIKENLVIHHIDDGEDYRHRHFSQETVFRSPDSEENRAAMCDDLANITGETIDNGNTPQPLRAGSREIPLLHRNEHAVIFDFNVLCGGNYSQKDYITVGKRFPHVGIVGVPVLDEYSEDAARRFLVLIDEFYDRRVKLMLTTEQPIEQLYQGKRLAFEFERLQSRLFEMQSQNYWQEPHLL